MATFQNMPEDVKRLICAELYHDSSELVRPLWNVSKPWRTAAETFVYRGFALAVGPDTTLKEDVKKLREHEFANKYLEHARCIHLTTLTQYRDEHEMANFTTGLAPLSSAFTLAEPPCDSYRSVFTSDSRVSLELAQTLWKPLVALIPEFKHLADVVIQSPTRLPPGLLATIRENHPRCRLHLWNFRFKSLHAEATDPDEHALAISPNLHSLSVMYMYRDSGGRDDYNGAAALRTVALAPNLKHVTMLGCRPASSPALYRARGRPIAQWTGFKPPIESLGDKVKTKLETLRFVGYSNTLTLEKLQKWTAAADLSTLKAFSCSIKSPSVLHHLATSNIFPLLHELTLILEPSKQDHLSGWEPAVESFFSVVNLLRSLALSGALHASLLRVIAERHGNTLKELSLNPFADGYDMPISPLRIDATDMKMLASTCPHLTKLSLTLRRSMGDRTETRCYEAIGTLENLKSANIKLDCTNGSAWSLTVDPDWDDFDKATQTSPGTSPKYYNGHLKRAIVNSALDETLARQIYSVMNSARPAKKPLLSLHVKTYGGSSFNNGHPGDLMAIVQHVSRSYRVTRMEGNKEDLEVVELGKESRERSDAYAREREKGAREQLGDKVPGGSAYVVFRHLWPHGEDADWRDAWTSWPLQTADESE